jgi:biotin carboxylase
MRVLLVEEGWHATMKIARGLRGAGMTVTAITANGTSARCRHEGVDWLSGPTVESANFVAVLDELVTARAIDAVLPLTEPTMCRLWDAKVAWADRLFPRTVPWQQALVRDKHALVDHLAAHGVAVPRSMRVGVSPPFDPAAAIARLGLPLVVKGATGSGGRRVAIASTAVELAQTLERAAAIDDRWIVQEHLVGPTYLVGGVFDRGRPLRVYGAEKVEQHPPRIGGAIQLRSLADVELVDAGLRAIEQLGWTGFASADLMRRADGQFVVLEINPRLWGSFAGAESAGVELFAPFAQLVLGGTPEPDLLYRSGSTCMIFPRYLNAAAHRNARGVLQALRDLRSEQGHDWRDPRFVVHIFHRLYWMKQHAVRL